MAITAPVNLSDESTLKTIETKKWTFAYNEVGEGHEPKLVLLHGSGPGATGWSNFNQNLGPLGEHFHCFAIDMPGWGRSSPATAEDRDHVEALELVMNALGLEQAALIGNSMGGMTAIRFTAENPERVTHLIPMGSGAPGTPLFAPKGGWSEGMKVLVNAYEDPTLESFRQLIEVMTFDSRFATDELVKQRRHASVAVPEHISGYLDARAYMVQNREKFQRIIPQLESLDVPTLLIHGHDDRTVPFENSLRLLAMIPSSTLVLLNQCGHWAQLEHAERFNRLVIDFVQNS